MRSDPERLLGANSDIDRRTFCKAAALAGGWAVAQRMRSRADAPERVSSGGWLDVNVSIGEWPLRRISMVDPAEWAAQLRAQGVTRAWVGSFDALAHKDLGAVNERLAHACRAAGSDWLLPFGSVNPLLPDWKEELRRCHEVHRMPGIRLFPNYHRFTLDNARLAELLGLAAERQLVVQISLQMEDQRMMHPLWRVSPVDPAPLPALVRSVPQLRLVLLNGLNWVRQELLRQLFETGRVWADLGMIEGVGGVRSFIRDHALDRLLFGSHAPLFYFAAAKLKLVESALSETESESILWSNGQKILG